MKATTILLSMCSIGGLTHVAIFSHLFHFLKGGFERALGSIFVGLHRYFPVVFPLSRNSNQGGAAYGNTP